MTQYKNRFIFHSPINTSFVSKSYCAFFIPGGLSPPEFSCAFFKDKKVPPWNRKSAPRTEKKRPPEGKKAPPWKVQSTHKFPAAHQKCYMGHSVRRPLSKLHVLPHILTQPSNIFTHFCDIDQLWSWSCNDLNMCMSLDIDVCAFKMAISWCRKGKKSLLPFRLSPRHFVCLVFWNCLVIVLSQWKNFHFRYLNLNLEARCIYFSFVSILVLPVSSYSACFEVVSSLSLVSLTEHSWVWTLGSQKKWRLSLN